MTGTRGVAQRATRGAVWQTSRVGVVTAVQAASAILLARRVLPVDLGAFAVAVATVAAVQHVGNLGISSLLVVSQQPDEEIERSLGVGTAVGLLVYSIVGALLNAVVWLLRDPIGLSDRVPPMIGVLTCGLVFDALRFAPGVRLRRRLAFGRIAVVDGIETLSLYAVQIALLASGVGAWALVAGQLARSVVGTSLTVYWGGSPRLPNVRGGGQLVRRALPYQFGPIAEGGFGVVHPFVVAAVLDQRQLGLWAWSSVLATPLIPVTVLLFSVGMPQLARLDAATPGHRRRSADVVARVGCAALGAAGGTLAGLAVPLVTVVFDARWLDAVPAAQACLAGLVPGALMWTLAGLAEAEQAPAARAKASVLGGALGVATLAVLTPLFGVSGAATATYLVVPLASAVALGRALRVASLRALLIGFSAFVGTWALASHLPGADDPFMLGLWALVTAAAATAVFGPLLHTEATLVRRAMRRTA